MPPRLPPEPVLETVLIEDGRIRLLHSHLLRLHRAGASPSQIEAVRVLAHTWSRTTTEPTVVRFDVTPDAMVSSAARAPASTDPVRLVTVGGYDPEDRAREQKRASRNWAIEAEAEAARRDGDEPLLVSASGRLGETTRASLFLIDHAGGIATPPARGILPGVTRSWVLGGDARDDRPLHLDDLEAVRSAFITSAGRGVVPVATIDGRPLVRDAAVDALAADWCALV
ncbi:MAG: aminotransferase class IV [Patulibacter sp.]